MLFKYLFIDFLFKVFFKIILTNLNLCAFSTII